MKQKPFKVSLDVRAILNDMADGVDEELAKRLQLWARTASKNVTRGKGLAKVHRDVGEGARSAVLAAYKASGLGQRPSYRQQDRGKYRRYSNGKMEKAIKNKGSITYNKTGINFIVKDEMDRFARQWYRLNFGTRGAGSAKLSMRPMEIFGITTSTRAELDNEPSKDFYIPAGFWSSTFSASTIGATLKAPKGRGRDAFYPLRRRGKRPKIEGALLSNFRPTGSIRGRRYLDAGATYINKAYPEKLEILIVDWLQMR